MAQSPKPFSGPNPAQLFRYQNAAFVAPAAVGTVYDDTLAEAGSASDAEAAAAIWASPVTEAGAAGDSEAGAAVFAGALAESGAANDAQAGGGATSDAITEPVAASDNLSGGLSVPAAQAEAGNALETLAAALAAAGDAQESGNAADALSTTQLSATSLPEALAAADDLAASGVLGADLAETGAAGDAVSGQVGGTTYDDALQEVAAAADAFASDYLPAASPGIGFAPWLVPQASGRIYDAVLTESAQARDFALAGLWIGASVTEGASAADGFGAFAELGARAWELGAAEDRIDGGIGLEVALAEYADPMDSVAPLGLESPTEEMLLMVTLLAGGHMPTRLSGLPAAMQRGQDASDELVAQAKAAARRILGGDVARLNAALAAAERSPGHLRAALLKAHGRMDPRKLAAPTYRVLVLAELSGRLAAKEQAAQRPTG